VRQRGGSIVSAHRSRVAGAALGLGHGKGEPVKFLPLRAEAYRSSVIVIVGVLSSIGGWWAATSGEQRAIHRELQERASWHAQIIEDRFSDLEHPVLAAADFVAANPQIDAEEFERFAAFASVRVPIIVGLSWAPLIRDAERSGFEAAAHQARPNFRILDRAADGTLVPAPARSEYIPLFAVKRSGAAQVAVGLDLGANPVRRAAFERARDEGRAIASPPIPGIDPDMPHQITAIITPIYRGGNAGPRDVAERRAALIGYIIGAYDLDAALSYAATDVLWRDERVSFARPAPSAEVGQALADVGEPAISATGEPLPPRDVGEWRIAWPLSLSGQQWSATFAFAPQAIAERTSDAPFAWLGLGLLLTGALASANSRNEERQRAVQQLVKVRTSELSAANENLRRSTQTLAAVLEAAPFAVIALDAEGRITVWNSGAERMFGHAAQSVIGLPCVEAVVPEDGRAECLEFIARIGQGEILRDFDVRRTRRDGSVVDFRLAASPFYDAGGRLQGTVFAIEDITESRKLEAQLYQAQKMEAIGQFTGGVAHDFNNLLGIAIGNIDLARQIKKDDDLDELLGDALGALLRGAELTQRLLAFARRQPLRPEHVALNELTLEVARLLRRLLRESIEIRLDLGESLWPVKIDRAQFEAALVNLATNARDAMAGGGRLTIATRNGALSAEELRQNPDVLPGDYVVVEVGDTGSGMAPEVLPHVFEPFFTTKRLGAGTGLGLSMVFGFIKQSGGHIAVVSEEGRGTTIRLYLPPDSDRTIDAAAPSDTIDPALSGRGECVLLVEDDPYLRRVTRRQLTELGYRVIEAESAAAALDILAGTAGIDLLFSDVVMPGGMSGVELARAAQLRWPKLKILLTSGYPEMLVDAPTADVRVLAKPYRNEALARAIHEALSR